MVVLNNKTSVVTVFVEVTNSENVVAENLEFMAAEDNPDGDNFNVTVGTRYDVFTDIFNIGVTGDVDESVIG